MPSSPSRARHAPILDVVLPGLTRAANHSALWMAVAGSLAARPSRRARLAAGRGLASDAVASLVANQVGKRLAGRGRPDRSSLPLIRRSPRVPASSSFPSGHSASAAAFAVGVAIEEPKLAIPVGVVAAAVAFSRVYTGMHYPSDVVAGLALGAGIAAVGAVVVPPRRRPDPRASGSRIELRPRPTGAGVLIVVNPRSGSGAAGTLTPMLRRELPDARIVVLAEGGDPVHELRLAGPEIEVLGVAGGDGTVNAAASVALDRDLPLLVIPGGTLNHFARDLGLDGPTDAIAACRAGTATLVDIGQVDGSLFLNTASLGSYPAFVKVRERWERRIGKPLAAVVAANSVLRDGGHFVDAEILGRNRVIAALFVGAGRYQPAGVVPAGRDRLDSGVLDVRYLEGSGRRIRLRPLAGLVAGQGQLSSPFQRVELSELPVRVHGETLLARDGETAPPSSPDVLFTIRPAALTVYRTFGASRR